MLHFLCRLVVFGVNQKIVHQAVPETIIRFRMSLLGGTLSVRLAQSVMKVMARTERLYDRSVFRQAQRFCQIDHMSSMLSMSRVLASVCRRTYGELLLNFIHVSQAFQQVFKSYLHIKKCLLILCEGRLCDRS